MQAAHRPVFSQTELIILLAEPLGESVARRLIRDGAASLGLGETFDQDAGLRLLERIAHRGGLVGIAARFSMSRLHLLGVQR